MRWLWRRASRPPSAVAVAERAPGTTRKRFPNPSAPAPRAGRAMHAIVPSIDLPDRSAMRTMRVLGNPRGAHPGFVVEAAGRPPLARAGRSLLSRPLPLTALIGRRWATTPVGGGGQKAGKAGPFLPALRTSRRSNRQAGMAAATRQTVSVSRLLRCTLARVREPLPSPSPAPSPLRWSIPSLQGSRRGRGKGGGPERRRQ